MPKPVASMLVTYAMFCLLLLGACHQNSEPTLKIGTNVFPGYELLYLAKELKLQPHNVQLVELSSSSNVMHLLKSGTLDGGALTLDEALTLADQGIDLTIVLVLDFSNGADVLISQPEYQELYQLNGKRIGYENTAVGALMLDAALQHGHLSAQEVTLIPIPVNQHYSAFKNHQIDAVITFSPVTSQIAAMGGRVLFDSSQIPGRIIDVLVIRTEVLPSYTQTLPLLLKSHFSTLDTFKQQPLNSAFHMQGRLGKTQPQAVLDEFNGLTLPDRILNQSLLNGTPAVLEQTSLQLRQLMLHKQLLNDPEAKKLAFRPIDKAQE